MVKCLEVFVGSPGGILWWITGPRWSRLWECLHYIYLCISLSVWLCIYSLSTFIFSFLLLLALCLCCTCLCTIKLLLFFFTLLFPFHFLITLWLLTANKCLKLYLLCTLKVRYCFSRTLISCVYIIEALQTDKEALENIKHSARQDYSRNAPEWDVHNSI